MNVKALLIIDMQNCFMNENTRYLPDKICGFIKDSNFDFVIFTKFINNRNSNFFKILKWEKCVSSPDTDIVDELAEFTTKENLFEKSCYSIFKSNKFLEFLNNNKVDELILCGVDTDGCVMASMFDGFDLGYNVKIMKNLCNSCSGKELNDSAFKIIRRNLQK